MRQRCLDPNSPTYAYYGARGIRILWNSFAEFRQDMGEGHKPGLSVGRIDNDGDYSKENCRWETTKEQNRNYRRNRLLTYNGETLPMVVWAERLGIKQPTLRARLEIGWTVERAVTTPLRKQSHA